MIVDKFFFRLAAVGRLRPSHPIVSTLFFALLIILNNNIAHAALRSWGNVRRQATVETSVKARERSLSSTHIFDASQYNPYSVNETDHQYSRVKTAPTVYGVFVPPTKSTPAVASPNGRRQRKKLSSSILSNYQQQQHAPLFDASSSQPHPTYDEAAAAQSPAGGSLPVDTPSNVPAYDDMQYYYEPPNITDNASSFPQVPVISLEGYRKTTTTSTTPKPRKKLSVAPFIPEKRRGVGSAENHGHTMAPTFPTKKLNKPNRAVEQQQQQQPRHLVEVLNAASFDSKHHEFPQPPPVSPNNEQPAPASTTNLDFPTYDELPAASAANEVATPASTSTTAKTSSTSTATTTPKIVTSKRPLYRIHQTPQPLFPPTTVKSTTSANNIVVETTDYTPLHIITHNKQSKRSDPNNHNMLASRRQAAPPPPPQHAQSVLITLHDIVPSAQPPAAATTTVNTNTHNNRLHHPRVFLTPPGLHSPHLSPPVLNTNNNHHFLSPPPKQPKLFDEDLPVPPSVLNSKLSPPSTLNSVVGRGGGFFPDEPYQQHTTFMIDAWAVPPPETFDCAAHGGVGYFADILRDCYVFYHCKPDGTYERLTCPAGLRFDEQARACVEKDTVQCGAGTTRDGKKQQKQFDCNGKTGFYADPFAPGKSSYYFCWGNNPPQHYDCPPGLLFNANCGACDLPQNCGGQPIANQHSQKSSAEVFNLNDRLQANFINTNQQLSLNDIHDGPNDIVRQPASKQPQFHHNVDNDKQINSRHHGFQLPPSGPPVPPLPIHTTFDCTGRYGLFADEHVSGCQSYWMCLPDGARHRLTCPPHLRFNEQLGTCDWPKNVPCRTTADNEVLVSGGPTADGRINVPQKETTSLNTLAARSACRDRVGFYADHGNHCKSYVYCSEDGKAFEYFCPPAQAYNETIGACEDAQHVQCYYQLAHDRAQQLSNNPSTAHRMVLGPTAVDCSGKNGLYADPFHSCKVYYYCNYGKQVKLQCPPGQIFNDELQMCDLEQNVVCMPPFDGTTINTMQHHTQSNLPVAHSNNFIPPAGNAPNGGGPNGVHVGLFEPNFDVTRQLPIPNADPAYFNQFKPQYQATLPNEHQFPQPLPPVMPSPQIPLPQIPFQPQIPQQLPPPLPNQLPIGSYPTFPTPPLVQQQPSMLPVFPPQQFPPPVVQQQQPILPPIQPQPQIPLQQPQIQPPTETGFDCRGLIGYYPDIMLGCRVYYYCRGDGSQFQFRCPANLRYNASLGICDWPEKVYCPQQIPQQPYLPTFYEPPVFDCRGQVGFMGDRDRDYRIFYFCEANGIKHRFSCPSNLKFNEARGVCDWPDSILRGPYQGRIEFDCSNRPQGYYGSPVNGIDNVVYYCPGPPTPAPPVLPGPLPGNNPPNLFTNDITAQLYAQKVQQQQNSQLLGRGEIPPSNIFERQNVAKKTVCPASLQYNPSIGACDWPENAASNANAFNDQNNFLQHSNSVGLDGNMLLHEQPPALQLQQLAQLQQSGANREEVEHAHRTLMKMIADSDAKQHNLNLNNNDQKLDVQFGYDIRQPTFNTGGLSLTLRKGSTEESLPITTTSITITDKPASRQLQSRLNLGNLIQANDIFNNASFDVNFNSDLPSYSTPATPVTTTKNAHSVCKLLGHGFWADEKRNCSDYIYCRDDDREFRFSCPPRLKFNEKLGACDLTPNVKCKQRDYSKLFSSLSTTTITSSDTQAEDTASRLLKTGALRHSGQNLPAARKLYRSAKVLGNGEAPAKRPGGQLKREQHDTSTNSTASSDTHNETIYSHRNEPTFTFNCFGRIGLFADRHTNCKQFYKCHEHGNFVAFKCSRDSLRFNERLQACEAKTNFECRP